MFVAVVVFFGGGEGNRTPVRKSIPSAFYERRLFFLSFRQRQQSAFTGSQPHKTSSAPRQTPNKSTA